MGKPEIAQNLKTGILFHIINAVILDQYRVISGIGHTSDSIESQFSTEWWLWKKDYRKNILQLNIMSDM